MSRCVNPLCKNDCVGTAVVKSEENDLDYCSFECYSLFTPKMYSVARSWEHLVDGDNDFKILKEVVNMINMFKCTDVDKAEMLNVSRATFKKWVVRLNEPIEFNGRIYKI